MIIRTNGKGEFMDTIWRNKQTQQKLDLIKGLISVEGNIIFGDAVFTKNTVNLHGMYYGGDEPKRVNFQVTKDHIEMLDNAHSIKEVIEVYENISYFKNE